MGFVDFTKLSFPLSSLAQPFDQMGSIPEYVFVILSDRLSVLACGYSGSCAISSLSLSILVEEQSCRYAPHPGYV